LGDRDNIKKVFCGYVMKLKGQCYMLTGCSVDSVERCGF